MISSRWEKNIPIDKQWVCGEWCQYDQRFTNQLLQVGPGEGYMLTVGEFNAALSTLGDSMDYHNGQKFTTKWVIKEIDMVLKPTYPLSCSGTWTKMLAAGIVLGHSQGAGGTTTAGRPTPLDSTLQQK